MQLSFLDLITIMGVRADDAPADRVTTDDLVDLLSCALYGSSWFCFEPDDAYDGADGDTHEAKMASVLLSGGTLHFSDLEGEDGPWELTLDALDRGAAIYAVECRNLLAQAITGGYDLYTADGILQCAMMGELVYG